MRLTLMIAATSLLAAGSAFADAHAAKTMADYDADGDGMVNMDEYRTGDGKMGFASLDADESGSISEDEMAGMAEDKMGFADYDADASGDVSEDEFYDASFRQFDADGDTMLNEEEYGAYEQERMTMEEDGGTDG